MKNYFLIILIFVFSFNVFSQENKSNYFFALNCYENNELDSALLKLKKNEDEISTILISKIYLQKKDINSAITILTKAINNENASKNIYFEMAKLYAAMEFEDEAINYLTKYFENNLQSLYYFQIIQQKEFQKIEKTSSWRIFWETNHYNKNYLCFEEIIQLQINNKHEEALDKLNKISENSYSYLKNYYLAKSYYYSNDLKNANKYIELSVSQNKKHLESQKLKFIIEKERNKYFKSISTLESISKYDNYDRQIIFDKSEIYFLLGENEKAKEEISYYLKFFSKNKEALLLKSKIDIALNNNNDALISLNKMIVSDEDLNKEAYLLRADIFYDYGNWELAQKDYSMLLDINPKEGEIYYKYGICWLNLKMTGKACHNLKKAVQLRYKKAQKDYYRNCE